VDQVRQILEKENSGSKRVAENEDVSGIGANTSIETGSTSLDEIIVPVGGGGLLSGTAVAMAGECVRVTGAEPAFEGADDCKTSLRTGIRLPYLTGSRTVADALRANVQPVPWSVISQPGIVGGGIFTVEEDEILCTMRLVVEMLRVWVEPSAVVGLASVLFSREWRQNVARDCTNRVWNVGVVLTGGNVRMKDVCKLLHDTVTE
jgi:threonine dehydratase